LPKRSKENTKMQQVEQYQTVIVGGGQAGLAVGYHLKRHGHPFVILDASERVGDSWRKRWDSLRLYSPASHDELPGMPFPAPSTSYPTKDEMGDYLEGYATRFDLPVRSGSTVETLTGENGRYVVGAGRMRFEADNVVVATGVFRAPYTPPFASEPTTTATRPSCRKGPCSSSAPLTRAPTLPTRQR
jgi:putative flavoprotein involved in K+ transport